MRRARAAARTRLLRLATLFALAAALSGGSACSPAFWRGRPPSARDSAAAKARMDALLAAHWSVVASEWPELAVRAGLTPSSLPDASEEATRRRARFARATLRALNEVPVNALPEPSYSSWLVLRSDLEMLSRRAAFPRADLSFAMPAHSPLRAAAEVLGALRFGEPEVRRRYPGMIGQVARMADTVRIRLMQLAADGVRLPRDEVPRAEAFVRSLRSASDGSPFVPSEARMAGVGAAERARLRAEASAAIETQLDPALARLASAIADRNGAEAPAAIGLGRYAGGVELYRYLLQRETTLDVSPEQAHSIGLQDVARLDTLVASAARASGLPVRVDSLRRLLAASATESARAIAEHLRAVGTRLDSLVLDSLGIRATQPFVVRPGVTTAGDGAWPLRVIVASPPDSAAVVEFDSTSVQLRVDWLLPALAFEALRPGRLLLLEMQRMDVTLPIYRRVTTRAGMSDGWSAYAIEQVHSLGGARSPREGFGALLREMGIACGLVIDTGVNYFGWSRDEAMRFLRLRLPWSDAELERQYIIPAIESPGRLSAGALGARELKGMRDWAGARLGTDFTRSGFLRAVLSEGAAPLPAVGAHVEWWLWRRSLSPSRDTSRASGAVDGGR